MSFMSPNNLSKFKITYWRYIITKPEPKKKKIGSDFGFRMTEIMGFLDFYLRDDLQQRWAAHADSQS